MDPVTILLSIVVILFFVKIYYYDSQHKWKNYPPGPTPLPIIGNLQIIDPAKPQNALIKLAEEYGTVFSIQLGQEKMVVLCGYDTVKDALINHAEEFSDRPHAPQYDRTSQGHGIIFSHGENWKIMRRFTLSALKDFGMGKKSLEGKIIEEVECLIQEFRSLKGKPFENHAMINAAVANIIISIMLDRRYEYDDPTILKRLYIINETVTCFNSTMVKLYNSFPLIFDLIPGIHHKIFENVKTMKEFVRETFTKQKQELDLNDQRNFIDVFLAKQLEGKPESNLYFHTDNLIEVVIDLFAAGIETTNTTLRWGLLLMLKYPEIQKRVQDEIDRVIGSAQPQFEHRKQMPYTEAVIHEIQRFGDVVPLNLPHATATDVTFRGYTIPKGTMVIPLLSSVLRDKAFFQKPDEFYPEHFLDSEGNFKKNEAFIPFSLGKRGCIGENLGKMKLFLFFTLLLQTFTFNAPPGAELDLTPALGFTNAPLPYEICAIPRLF
ncbi:cytochrome P450 2K1-like [Hyperolius riggenbachi]|uniref:cytochrome P450 2K1-like n=1 Tax=Hyperolius riggenbachi TaxID=752182 RepID=UPI0035A39205